MVLYIFNRIGKTLYHIGLLIKSNSPMNSIKSPPIFLLYSKMPARFLYFVFGSPTTPNKSAYSYPFS